MATPKVSAASARSHTRSPKPSTSRGCCGSCCTGIFFKIFLLAVTSFIAWFYQAIQPPPPAICGTPFGPPVTAPRIQLSDGRFLAYKEAGVPKEHAKHKIVIVHAFGQSRLNLLPVSQDFLEELGVYLIGFDRAGYGQSDPNPGRTIKSEAFDIQELADIMHLGDKFYVIATSIGGYSAWACLKYIPHRLAGVAMLAPVTNYWWSGIPYSESLKAFLAQPLQDQIATSIAHYVPVLTYWWNTQKFFPKSSVIEQRFDFWNDMDKDIIRKFSKHPAQRDMQKEATQQGIYESLLRDQVAMFGRWEFDPSELKNPFENGEGSVHIWHGDEDFLVPLMLQQYVKRKLPWVHLHVVPGAGHLLFGVPDLPAQILKTLLKENVDYHSLA